jgi:hypothetical protein
MSTILFFTSDRLAFANISQSATTETVLFVPDPATGTRLFLGNSTMISYDGRCNIASFDGSKASLTIDTLNNRLGIGISSPTSALHIKDPTGIQLTGPATITGSVNITGTTVFTGATNVVGTITATYLYGSAMGLTSIPAARLIGTLPGTVYGDATIPLTAISGYNNGILGLSGGVVADTLGITNSLSVNVISSGNAFIDSLQTTKFSTAIVTASTFTVGTLFANTISSGSIGNLLTAAGSFSSLSAGTANVSILNTTSLSIATATVSSLTVGNLVGRNISASTAFFSTLSSGLVTATTLSSYIVYASSIHTPNIYVTNIYANDGGIANVVASSLNASKSVFLQVIASSFQGTLWGKNILVVETL